MPDENIITNFSTAFCSKFTALVAGSNNDFYSSIVGRLYEFEAPAGTPYPYAVYQIISAPKEKTFTEEYTRILLQLSIYSTNSSSSEVKLAYHYANVLFDECEITITGSTLVWLKEVNVIFDKGDHTTPSGTQSVNVCFVDFEILTSLD